MILIYSDNLSRFIPPNFGKLGMVYYCFTHTILNYTLNMLFLLPQHLPARYPSPPTTHHHSVRLFQHGYRKFGLVAWFHHLFHQRPRREQSECQRPRYARVLGQSKIPLDSPLLVDFPWEKARKSPTKTKSKWIISGEVDHASGLNWLLKAISLSENWL